MTTQSTHRYPSHTLRGAQVKLERGVLALSARPCGAAFNKEDWPYLQFSADDAIACRAVTNEVRRCSFTPGFHS